MSNAPHLSEAFRSRPDALTADDLSVHEGADEAALEPRDVQDSDVREIAQPAQPSSDRSSWMAGTLLGGKYTMVRPLGVGGMGVVWLARNEGTGANVAIKLVLPRNREDEAEILARLRREAYARRRCGTARSCASTISSSCRATRTWPIWSTAIARVRDRGRSRS
jgi:serine/threonine protein kinase